MSEQTKDFVKEITPMEVDFARWYTDVIMKTDMADYSPVKGCMVIKPYGYAVWENIQRIADKKFKATGHKNAYFPLLIPESFLQKEASHFEGFAPEVLWVTHGGNEELAERLFVRPTSETIINTMFSKWIGSYRDLPLLINQWCNVIRWEKTTRPFLRTAEFLWQEGHTCHATKEDAMEETLKILEIYRDVAENYLAMPVVVGRKSEKERFAGADETYTIEAMMHDGKALQAGTSHYLGQNFSKMFDITYLDRDDTAQHVFTTSWGISTRMIGGIIMTHGDNRGLVMPPEVAPTHVVIVPVAQHKSGVLEKARQIQQALMEHHEVELDDRDNYSPGWKFNEWEMKGVPLRIEIGPRDIENGQVIAVRRDTFEKEAVRLDHLETYVTDTLKKIQSNMFRRAQEKRDANTFTFDQYDAFKERIAKENIFAKVMWCGNRECEERIKEETSTTIRCIPDDSLQEKISGQCLCCGKPARHMVYMAKAY